MKKEAKTVKEKKKSSPLDIVLTVIGILLLSITTVIVVSRFISKDKMVFGMRSDIVLTSSMASVNDEVKDEYIENGWTNQLAVHDWIFTTKVNDESELHIGDIVTYNNPTTGVTTHRIVGIIELENYKLYTIRGDAAKKNDSDGNFKYEAIIGKVTTNAGQFGQVIYFLQTIWGVVMMVGLAVICFLYSFLSDRIDKKEEIKNNEK